MDDIVGSGNATLRQWYPNPQTRGTWNIYSTCVITTGLCVWQAIHLNMPPPGEKPHKQFLRKVLFLAFALFAPEFIAFIAWMQYSQAKTLYEKMNETGSTRSHQSWYSRLLLALFDIPDRVWIFFSGSDVRRDLKAFEQCLPTKPQFTMECAFFIIMGGVVLLGKVQDPSLSHENPTIIDQDALEPFLENWPHGVLNFSHEDVASRSKSNDMGKAITFIQIVWFCAQCATRLAYKLDISLLELNTFAHCICACIVFAFWWNKPYDVATHVVLQGDDALALRIAWELQRISTAFLPGTEIVVDNEEDETQPEIILEPRPHRLLGVHSYRDSRFPDQIHRGWPPYSHWNSSVCMRSTDFIPDTLFRVNHTGEYRFIDQLEHTDNRGIHLVNGRLDAHDCNLWKRLRACRLASGRLPVVTHPATIRQIVLRSKNRTILLYFGQLSYESRALRLWSITSAALTIGSIAYGLLHALAWDFDFDTKAETTLWRFSSAFVASYGAIFVPTSALVVRYDCDLGVRRHEEDMPKWCLASLWVLGILMFVYVCVSILARPYLVFESFYALPNSPSSVWEIPHWAAYLPHIS